MSEDPTDTLELLATRLVAVEEQLARQATWTLAGVLAVLAGTLLLFGLAALHAAQTQHHSAVLLRVCSVGTARMPEGRVTWCNQRLAGFRLARTAVAGDAVTVDSLATWAQGEGWVPPATTTLYPEPPP